MTIHRIISILRPLCLTLVDEKRLQAEIEDAFTAAGLGFQREVRLSAGDVIDFLVEGGIGAEVKIKGGKRDIYHQMQRYSYHDRITSLILISNVPMGLPPEIGGKPAYFHSLAAAWL